MKRKAYWPVAVLALILFVLVVASFVVSKVGLHGILKWPEGITAIAILLTLFFIAWQALLTRQAVVSAEAASQVELRAYLVVSLSIGSYQEREKNIKFEGNPTLSNTGKTPAHNVRYRTNSAILNDEDANGYSYPPGENEVGGYVLGVEQTFKLSVVHRDFCDSQDVEAIMLGDGRAFYYWGVVYYDDAFGNPQTTEFCHRLYFYKAVDSEVWKVNGHYLPRRNKAS